MKITADERAIFARFGKAGGKARAAGLTKARRQEIAAMGGKAKKGYRKAKATA